jgi:hypothetical protein
MNGFLQGYLHKQARELEEGEYDPKKVRKLPGFNPGYLKDPGGRIKQTYKGWEPPDGRPYFPRMKSIEESGQVQEDIWNHPYRNKLSDMFFEAQRKKGFNGERVSIPGKDFPVPETPLPSGPAPAHPAAVKPEYLQALKKALPGFDVRNSWKLRDIRNRPAVTEDDLIWRDSNYVGPGELTGGGDKPVIQVPPEGPTGLGSFLHEYTHAEDPALQPFLKGQGDRPPTYEPEIPAMATERAVEASPYVPEGKRRPFTTPMGKQIEKFGPTLRGNFQGDLSNIRNWVHALRQQPAAVQAKQPFAYHGDTRTPEDRAKALGTAYQNYMNYYAGKR